MTNVPIQSLIDHIKTAIDVDPWAKEMAEELLKEHEIIRCAECKYWHINCMENAGRHGCDVIGDYTGPDYYCASAERR